MYVHVIRLPDVGEGVAEAEIAEWLVKVGDEVREDQPLASVMTDKASVEIPSPHDGEVLWLAGKVGEVITIGSEFVKLQVAGEGGQVASSGPAEPAPERDQSPVIAKKTTPASTPSPPQDSAAATAAARPPGRLPRAVGDKPVASPAVRQRARNLGIDLAYVHGSGPAGRISHEDIELYVSGTNAPIAHAADSLRPNTDVTELKISGLRRQIAERMQTAVRHIPHITYVEEVDVTELESLREYLNESRAGDRSHLTLLPFLMRSLVKAVKSFPEVNARFDDDSGVVQHYGAAHIGIATQTEKGLLVPVVRHTEARDLWDCAKEIGRLTEAARSGNASRDELSGSTITITSLGALGGLISTPIINYPEVAIIAVNKISLRPVYQATLVVPRKLMNISASFDHRLIDGWVAASFVQCLKGLLEHPATIMAEAD